MKWNDFNDATDQQAKQHENTSTEDIRNQLLGRLESVLHSLLPAGKIRHNQFVIGDINGNAGGSMIVDLHGKKAGMWHDFATGDGGDIFDLWAKVKGFDTSSNFPALISDIQSWLGHAPISRKAPTSAPVDELGKHTAKWDYTDSDGNLLACVYRYDTPTGKQFRPWDVKSRKQKSPDTRPLYNQVGIKDADSVVLVEGEKCADSLIAQGIPATTAMNGAKAPLDKTDWSPLADKKIIIWPDNDIAGKEYAKNAAQHLSDIAASISILTPPDNWAEKYDAADAVNDRIDIVSFLQTATSYKSGALSLLDWKATAYSGSAPIQKFLVDSTFPMGVVSILAAMGDTGKGMLTLHLALQIATGTAPEVSTNIAPICFGNRVQQFGTAVIFTAEDDKGEVHRRLERLDPQQNYLNHADKLIIIPLPNAGGAFPLVNVTKSGPEATKQFYEIEKQLLEIKDLRLIVFDPLSSFIHADVNADPAAGSFTTGLLASLATKTEAALIIAHHMRKPAGGKPITTAEQARDAIRGTSALVDGVRTAYAMWPASSDHQNMVFKALSKQFERNMIYQGAIVKSNSPADRTIRTYMRQSTGLLADITDRLKNVKISNDELKNSLILAVAQSARNGHPFTHTGGTGVFKQRNRLPIIFHNVGRDRLEKVTQELLNDKYLIKGRADGSKEEKWLDTPSGPFAEGVGEFKYGAEEVKYDQ